MREWIVWKFKCIWYKIDEPVLNIYDNIKALVFGAFILLTPFAFIGVPIVLAELGYVPYWIPAIPIAILILIGCWAVGSLVVVGRR
jgi:hypothetical protein